MKKDFWTGKRVFITGHTGFKGSWLSIWLASLGANVKGYSLSPPTKTNLFEEARVYEYLQSEINDIRDRDKLKKSIESFQPDVVFHLAAQPLVRYSYNNPIETFETNVIGSVNLLEAVRTCKSVRALVNITTDKCYDNREWVWGYREDDPLGGYDPYSSSKACSELVTAAYRQSFFYDADSAGIASARAGNVIGGGDWAEDRLVPDILRSFEGKSALEIRNPNSIRPWQHVLEPISGYMKLAESLWTDKERFSGAWNFGPNYRDARSVTDIVKIISKHWGSGIEISANNAGNPHEANVLKLDIAKSLTYLGWEPKWTLEIALEKVVEWHRSWLNDEDVRLMCLKQIDDFCGE